MVGKGVYSDDVTGVCEFDVVAREDVDVVDVTLDGAVPGVELEEEELEVDTLCVKLEEEIFDVDALCDELVDEALDGRIPGVDFREEVLDVVTPDGELLVDAI